MIDFKYILEVESKHLVIDDWIWEIKWHVKIPAYGSGMSKQIMAATSNVGEIRGRRPFEEEKIMI